MTTTFNKSEIFKNAWAIVKEIACTISEGLKKAWAKAKNTSVFTSTTPVVVGNTDNATVSSKNRTHLVAVSNNDGEIELINAYYDRSYDKKGRVDSEECVITNGFINRSQKEKSYGEFIGINFDNVKKVIGQTYNVKETLKEMGFTWDKTDKAWIK